MISEIVLVCFDIECDYGRLLSSDATIRMTTNIECKLYTHWQICAPLFIHAIEGHHQPVPDGTAATYEELSHQLRPCAIENYAACH